MALALALILVPAIGRELGKLPPALTTPLDGSATKDTLSALRRSKYVYCQDCITPG